MKKICYAIMCLMLIVPISMVFSGCFKNKTAITSEQFITAMEEKGYTITDATDQFEGVYYIQRVSVAVQKDGLYQIEFYEISDNISAKLFYINNKTIFENSDDIENSYTSVDVGNYSKYSSWGERYKVVSRIENTVIYLNVSIEYKDIVTTLLDELGY